MSPSRSPFLVTLLLVLASTATRGQEERPEWVSALSAARDRHPWRNVGPAAMGGRITDVDAVESRPAVFYVASATGGLWKTENAGTTFRPVFSNGGSSSVGAVAVCQTDPNEVWVGMGEANARNSVTWGDGVYLSKDGGKTFEHRGLSDARHIGRVVIHPENKDIVLVAALGHIWSANQHRGLYRTQDGGETWSQVLALGEDTGCIDVRFCPSNPNIVLAAAYEVRRGANDANDPDVRYGKKAGIYRSEDGGRSFQRITAGLPTVDMGRIGLDFCRNPGNVAYAVIETRLTGGRPPDPPADFPKESAGRPFLGIRAEDGEGGARLLEVTAEEPAARAKMNVDDVVVEFAGRSVTTFRTLIAAIESTTPGESVVAKVRRGTESLELSVVVGAAPPERAVGQLGGQLENAQARQGPFGFETGGVFRSDDAGLTWTRVNSLTPRPFYFSKIRVDPSDPERVWVLGIQCYRSADGGKTFSNDAAPQIHVDHHALWINPKDGRHLILGNDGGLSQSFDRGENFEFQNHLDICQFYGIDLDQREPYWIYGGLQDNGSWAFPSRSRAQGGVSNDDAFKIGEGDGFWCEVDPEDQDTIYYESQNGAVARMNLKTAVGRRVARPRPEGDPGSEGQQAVRFNWETPFKLSPFNSKILYFAGHRLMRSVNQGASSVFLSDELTRTGKGAATALAVSPRREGVIYVGTEEGSLWVTRDEGRTWTDLSERLPLLASMRWVSHIEASRHEDGTAYVVLDGHRMGDIRPAVFRTRDFGETFEDLSADLPPVSARVLREDPRKRQLLYVGHEVGVSVSLDDGRHWMALGKDLPTVPVHDIRIHNRDREIVIGTHGRGAWILDAVPFQELAGAALPEKPALLCATRVVAWVTDGTKSRFGQQGFQRPSPPNGLSVHYWLAADVDEGQEVALTVSDANGVLIRKLKTEKTRGLHSVRWDLARAPQGRARTGSPVPAGSYVISLQVGEEKAVRSLVEVVADPLLVTEGGAQ